MPRQIILASRPSGWPVEDNFALTEADRPDLADGQIRVRNLFMSVDPYMRGRMNDVKSYVPPFRLGEPLEGGAIGDGHRVPLARPGQRATWSCTCWAGGTRPSLPARQARRWPSAQGLSPSAYLGVLGMPTLTAYVGVLDIAALKPGEAVFVSGAAGAVGSMAGQIAKLKGAGRVIGSAGTDEKVRWLREIGFDAAFNYQAGAVLDQLREAAPDGIDVYFDNVGADHLDAALVMLNNHGRVAMCGAIAHYNATEPPPGPAQPRPGRQQAAHPARLHHHRSPAPDARHDRRRQRLAAGGQDRPRRDRRRRPRPCSRRLHRPAPRGQHRQDARTPLTRPLVGL